MILTCSGHKLATWRDYGTGVGGLVGYHGHQGIT